MDARIDNRLYMELVALVQTLWGKDEYCNLAKLRPITLYYTLPSSIRRQQRHVT